MFLSAVGGGYRLHPSRTNTSACMSVHFLIYLFILCCVAHLFDWYSTCFSFIYIYIY